MSGSVVVIILKRALLGCLVGMWSCSGSTPATITPPSPDQWTETVTVPDMNDPMDAIGFDTADQVSFPDLDVVVDSSSDGDSGPDVDGGGDVAEPDQADGAPEDVEVAEDISSDSGGCSLPAPQCVGAPSPFWTLADHQVDPPVERSIDEFEGKVTVVVFLESS